jgi:hypothetical protein
MRPPVPRLPRRGRLRAVPLSDVRRGAEVRHRSTPPLHHALCCNGWAALGCNLTLCCNWWAALGCNLTLLRLLGCAALPQLIVAVGLAHVRDRLVRDLRAAALLVGRARPDVQARVPQALPRGTKAAHWWHCGGTLRRRQFVCLFASLLVRPVGHVCAASMRCIKGIRPSLGSGSSLARCRHRRFCFAMAAANQTMPSCAAQRCTALQNAAVIVRHATAGIADVVERRLCGLIQLP